MSGTVMRSVRDTFLHYLSDNLPTLAIHGLRFDKAEPAKNVPQVGQINVAFHNMHFDIPGISEQLVTVDVLGYQELTVVDQVDAVVSLLQTAAYAKLNDYSSGSPVAVDNKLVFWDVPILFRPVQSENYFHMSALIHLKLRYS